MITSRLVQIKSHWRDSIGDFRPAAGSNVIKNFWNHKAASDYLGYMKLESF